MWVPRSNHSHFMQFTVRSSNLIAKYFLYCVMIKKNIYYAYFTLFIILYQQSASCHVRTRLHSGSALVLFIQGAYIATAQLLLPKLFWRDSLAKHSSSSPQPYQPSLSKINAYLAHHPKILLSLSDFSTARFMSGTVYISS